MKPGSSSVLTAANELNHEETFIATRAAEAAACIAGIAPAKAAYSSPHVRSKRFTDHLHFIEEALYTERSFRSCQAVAENRRRALNPTNAFVGTKGRGIIRQRVAKDQKKWRLETVL